MVMGVSACGKSTLAARLATELDAPFLEGDDFHPAENIAKMAAGSPLNSADRIPWIKALCSAVKDSLESRSCVVFSCSALTRDIRQSVGQNLTANLVTLFLNIDPQRADQRIRAREGHFMPPALLKSQFASLDWPGGEPFTFTLEADQPIELLVKDAKEALLEQSIAKSMYP